MGSNQFISYGAKGLLGVGKLGLIDTHMDDEVRRRLKILAHWHKFGLAWIIHAFGISKSTLYAWRKSLAGADPGNTVALKPASKRPRQLREANIDPATHIAFAPPTRSHLHEAITQRPCAPLPAPKHSPIRGVNSRATSPNA